MISDVNDVFFRRFFETIILRFVFRLELLKIVSLIFFGLNHNGQKYIKIPMSAFHLLLLLNL